MVTAAQYEAFQTQGFFTLGPLLGPATLERLRSECDRVRIAAEGAMAEGSREGINLRGKRYFLARLHEQSEPCRVVCVGSPLVEVAVTLLGPDVRLYWNQAVIKAPRQGASFAWHQDTGYVPIEPREYLTCWIALDEATLENGCIRVLPGSHRWGLQPHHRDPELGDLVGYAGPDEGMAVPLPAGHAAIFSSLLLHCSGPNTSTGPRRAYVVQYAPTGAVNPRSGEPWGDCLPVAAGGHRLFPAAAVSQ